MREAVQPCAKDSRGARLRTAAAAATPSALRTNFVFAMFE
jgi:hypothetical protein